MPEPIPFVIEQGVHGERAYDIYSRLLKDRIVFVNGAIDTEMSQLVIAQILFLASESKDKPIDLYVNSPGGEVTAGMSIFDTMRNVPCHVNTYCVGMAASMAAVLLAAGDTRYALPNAEIMIHQPLGGARGPAADIEIEAKWILRTKEKLERILSELTGQPLEKIKRDTDRNFWMSAQEAKEYGLIDEIVIPTKPSVRRSR
jgi:ATP-dependent Clp protease protease subunit